MRTKWLKSAVASALLVGASRASANDGITAAGDWLVELFIGAMLMVGGVVSVIALLVGLMVCLSSAARRPRPRATSAPTHDLNTRSLLAGPTLHRQDTEQP